MRGRQRFQWEPVKRQPEPSLLAWRLYVRRGRGAKLQFSVNAVYAERFNHQTHKVLIGTSDTGELAIDLIPIDEPNYGRLVSVIGHNSREIRVAVTPALKEMGLSFLEGSHVLLDPSIEDGVFVVDLSKVPREV